MRTAAFALFLAAPANLGRQFQIKRCFRHAVIAVQACNNGSGAPLTRVDDRALID